MGRVLKRRNWPVAARMIEPVSEPTDQGATLSGLKGILCEITQGSVASSATLGWRAQSLRDWRIANVPGPKACHGDNEKDEDKDDLISYRADDLIDSEGQEEVSDKNGD